MLFDISVKANFTNFLECDDKSYCSLMELYEDNYLLLKNILRSETELFLNDEQENSIHINLIDNQKYTSIYNLSIQNKNNIEFKFEPQKLLNIGQFTLRVYHDAKLLEADLSSKNRSHSQNVKKNWYVNTYINECLKSINIHVVRNRREAVS